MDLHGSFQISDWQETNEQSFDDTSKLNKAKVKLSYSGSVVGTSELEYSMFYQADGNAHFTGFEFINAQINGQACELVLKHNGCFESGVASSVFKVVKAQGAEALVGLAGSFTSKENGAGDYEILAHCT